MYEGYETLSRQDMTWQEEDLGHSRQCDLSALPSTYLRVYKRESLVGRMNSNTKQVVRDLHERRDQALGDYFSEYDDQLCRMVRFRLDRRLCGRVDAHDVVQEAFLDASQRLDSYLDAPDVPVHVWLRRITMQALVNIHRRHLGTQKRNAGQEVELRPPAFASSMTLAAHFVAHLTSPSQAAMKAEAIENLESVLEEMDEIDREVLILRHFEELTNQQTAEILGLQKAAASNRYIRALRRLRAHLEKIPDFFDR